MMLQDADRKLAWAAVTAIAFSLILLVIHWFPLKEWQDLISGLLTIVAAGIGGLFLTKQIAASDRIETRRRAARFNAARATLPLTLSTITEYAVKSATAYGEALKQCGPSGIARIIEPPKFPNVPITSVSDFQIILEFDDSGIAKEQVTKLLSLLQVHRARVHGFEEYLQGRGWVTMISSGNIEEEIIGSAELYARAGSLYSFGRFLTETTESITAQHIEGALEQLGFFAPVHHELFARAKDWTPTF